MWRWGLGVIVLATSTIATAIVGCAEGGDPPRPSEGGAGGAGGEGGQGGAAGCSNVTGIWALTGDCPVGECTIEQSECNLTVVCAPLVELLFTGTVEDRHLTFGAPVATCEATLEDSGLLEGTCDVGCSFAATPGPSQETGWGCYLGDMPYGCVCDYEGTGDHSVAPNALACPSEMPCCRTYPHKGAKRCGCWNDPYQCQLVDENNTAVEVVAQCPPAE